MVTPHTYFDLHKTHFILKNRTNGTGGRVEQSESPTELNLKLVI